MKTLLLVYGTLKENYHNNYFLKNPYSKKLGEAETKPLYTMYDGNFPIVERNGTTSIKGEVWEVTSEKVLEEINALENYSGIPGHHSNWYDVDEVDTPFGKALMYVMDDSKRSKNLILKSGIWQRKY